MPEVVEIKKYADFIKKCIKNEYITKINILKGRYKTHGPFELYNNIIRELPLKVIDVKTKGKFLYIELENNFYIFSTLGLQGGWVFDSVSKAKSHIITMCGKENKKNESRIKTKLNNLNVEFVTKKGSLYYYDPLSFGTIKIINNIEELNKKLNLLGPDIMDISTTFEIFNEQITKKINMTKAIGNVLVNQKIISGIGNYLRSDILWLSHISPFRKIKNLTRDELYIIYKNARLLTYGNYNFKNALKLKIVKKDDKLPKDYNRDFFIYGCEEDLYGNKIKKEELYEGSIKRYVYWTPIIQK